MALSELAPASDTSQTEPQTLVGPVEPEAGIDPTLKKKKVFSLIRDIKRRISDKDLMNDKSTISSPPAAARAEAQPIVTWATPEPIVYGTV